ncbi:unnamed protein product, partial [Ectocarpus sp. 12 AP-2014]
MMYQRLIVLDFHRGTRQTLRSDSIMEPGHERTSIARAEQTSASPLFRTTPTSPPTFRLQSISSFTYCSYASFPARSALSFRPWRSIRAKIAQTEHPSLHCPSKPR